MSEASQMNNYNYSVSDPILERSKKYAFTVLAKNSSGKANLKNGGLSEVGWFYYGYPENGLISTEVPNDEYGFTLRENRYFKWQPPNNLLDNQQYSYQFRIVEMEEGQLPTDAIDMNMPYYEKVSNITSQSYSYDLIVEKKFESMKQYAWQVIAYTEDQEIAKSHVNSFFGPPFIEAFKSGNHLVTVQRTTTTTMKSLSGSGKVKVSSDGSMQEVQFNDVHLAQIGGEWNMISGAITQDISHWEPIPLNPEFEKNDIAFFQPQQMRLNKDGLYLKGKVRWAFPFAVQDEKSSELITKSGWLNYDDYRLIGSLALDEDFQADLLDPLNFKLTLNKKSDFIIRGQNNYAQRFLGTITLPEKITRTGEERIILPLDLTDQLFYNTVSDKQIDNIFEPVKDVNVVIDPVEYIIDFSEDQSPKRLTEEASWKGLYLKQADITYGTNLDKKNRLILSKAISHKLLPDNTEITKHWIDSKGMQLEINSKFSDNANKAYFNTFPALLKSSKIIIENNHVSESHVKGSIKIPVIHTKKEFNFTMPLTNDGFNDGYLDENMEGSSFIFNKDKEDLKSSIVIRRAVFEGYDRLAMSIDFEWPALDIKLTSVNGFIAWGNYEIGFEKPNGSIPLSQQVTGQIKGFPLMVSTLGCGSNKGLYAFGVSGTIVMSADVAGSNGPPVVNLYSVSKNELLGTYIPPKETNQNTTATQTPSSTAINDSPLPATNNFDDFDSQDQDLDKIEEDIQQQINEASEKALQNAQDKLDEFKASANKPKVDVNNIFNLDEIKDEDNASESEDFFEINLKTSFSEEELMKELDNLIEFLPDEMKEEARKVKHYIGEMEKDDQINIFKDITNVGNLLKRIAKDELDKLLEEYVGVITETSDGINREIESTIDDACLLVENTIEDGSRLIIHAVADGLKAPFDEQEDEEIIEFLDELADALVKETTEVLYSRIKSYADTEVKEPITTIISSFASIVEDSIKTQLQGVGYAMINNGVNANLEGKIDVLQIVESVKSNILETYFSPDTLMAILIQKKDSLLATLDPMSILTELSDSLSNTAVDFIIDKAIDKAKDIATDYAKKVFEEEGGEYVDEALKTIGLDNDINFDDIGGKFKGGEIGAMVACDPVKVQVYTPFVEIVGEVALVEDDETYGDVMMGDVDIKIKIPKPFTINSKYINGRVDDLDYWFCQASPGGEKALGLTEKRPVALQEYVPFGPVSLAGIAGRIYYHMNITDDERLVPDASTNYGAYMNMVFMDTKSNGKDVRLELAAEVLSQNDDNGNENYNINFDGNMQCGSTNPTVEQADLSAPIQGLISISYNSAEQHFIGHGEAKIEDPALCAEGVIDVDLKPNEWMVAIGNPEQRISIVPACIGWGGTGWLIVDNYKIDLGLGITFGAIAKSDWIEFWGKQYQGYAGFELAAGITTIIIYNPNLILQEAGLWAEAWAGIGINHRKKGASSYKTWELASAYLYGEAKLTFHPPPTVASGMLEGTMKVLIWKVDFDMKFKQTL
jgi:hypothetical protein